MKKRFWKDQNRKYVKFSEKLTDVERFILNSQKQDFKNKVLGSFIKVGCTFVEYFFEYVRFSQHQNIIVKYLVENARISGYKCSYNTDKKKIKLKISR